MKTNKIIYWTATAVMSLVFLYSAQMYLFNYELASGYFVHLGFPTWLIYPLAALKILALIVIFARKPKFLKELAYAGLLFDAVLAFTSHQIANDGGSLFSVIAIITISVSWIYDRKVFAQKAPAAILQSNLSRAN